MRSLLAATTLLLGACAGHVPPTTNAPPLSRAASPWTVVLENCPNAKLGSIRGARVVIGGFGAARVDGDELRPLPIPAAASDSNTMWIDDVVGRWPDRAFVVYSTSRGDDTSHESIGRFEGTRLVPSVATNAYSAVYASSIDSLLVLTTDAEEKVHGHALGQRSTTPIATLPALDELTRSGVGIRRLHEAVALSSGDLFIAAEDGLTVHHLAPGRPPRSEDLGRLVTPESRRASIHSSAAISLVPHGEREVYAAFAVQRTHEGDGVLMNEAMLARFDGSSWKSEPAPEGGPIEAFDVGGDGALWAAIDGTLLRRTPAERQWRSQSIDGHVLRVWAAHGAPVWAITKQGVLWSHEGGGATWRAVSLPASSDGHLLHARTVSAIPTGDTWLTATTDDNPDWPDVEGRADTLLRLGAMISPLRCAATSASQVVIKNMSRARSSTACLEVSIVPGANLGGWTHAGDEAAIRSAVTRIVPAAKIESLSGFLRVTTPDKASAARLAKMPVATFAGWTPIAAQDCE